MKKRSIMHSSIRTCHLPFARRIPSNHYYFWPHQSLFHSCSKDFKLFDDKFLPMSTKQSKLTEYELPDKNVYNFDKYLTETINRYRSWHLTSFGHKYMPKKCDFQFSVMSYNVLAQSLLNENYYLYQHCRHKDLIWNNRRSAIDQELNRLNPDILCFQEVECSHYEIFYLPILSAKGYEGIFKKRTGNKQDGCAIFYRSNLLKVVHKTEVEYRKSDVSFMDRDNVGITVLFESKCGSKRSRFCVATTHLLFNPKRDDIRLAQLSLLIAEINKVARKSCEEEGHHPVILCGDFNTEPYSPLYNFVSCGEWKNIGPPPMLSSNYVRGQRIHGFVDLSSIPFRKLKLSNNCEHIDEAIIREKTSNEDNLETSSQEKEMCKTTLTKETISHPFNFLSVYKHYKMERGNRYRKAVDEITTHHKKACITLDYIFYSVDSKNFYPESCFNRVTDVKESSLKLHSRLSVLSSAEVEDVGGLPNSILGSDHLSLMARFVLRDE